MVGDTQSPLPHGEVLMIIARAVSSTGSGIKLSVDKFHSGELSARFPRGILLNIQTIVR